MFLGHTLFQGSFAFLDGHKKGVERLAVSQQRIVAVVCFKGLVAPEWIIADKSSFTQFLEVLGVVDRQLPKVDVVSPRVQPSLTVDPLKVTLFLDLGSKRDATGSRTPLACADFEHVSALALRHIQVEVLAIRRQGYILAGEP